MNICLAGSDIASQFKDLRKSFEDRGHRVFSYVPIRSASPIVEEDAYDYVAEEEMKLPALLKPQRPFNTLRNRATKRIWNFYWENISPRILKKWAKKIDFFIFFAASLKIWNFYRQNIKNRILKELAEKVDLFIVIWESFRPDFEDLAYIKRKGCKIAFIFCGDDARWLYGLQQEFETYNLGQVHYDDAYNYSSLGLQKRLSRIRAAERYADFVFSKREQAQLQLRPFYHFPMSVYTADYDHRPHQRLKPVIVHAPSNAAVKGTQEVLGAFATLEAEQLAFEVELLQNVPHRETMNRIAKADIVVDQLTLPGAGKLASEALAMGKVVVTRMSLEDYPQGFHRPDCPMVHADKSSITDVLRELIRDHERRQSLALRARKYAEEMLDVSWFTEKILKLAGGERMPYDYVPTFFRNQYKPQPGETRILNQSIDKVRHCDWYRQYVAPGSRSGLEF